MKLKKNTEDKLAFSIIMKDRSIDLLGIDVSDTLSFKEAVKEIVFIKNNYLFTGNELVPGEVYLKKNK